jgi:hypothetical protein
MIFHVIGTACISATLAAGLHIHPVCREYESPRSHASYAECATAVNDRTNRTAEIPVIPDGYKWIVLHCVQLPAN